MPIGFRVKGLRFKIWVRGPLESLKFRILVPGRR